MTTRRIRRNLVETTLASPLGTGDTTISLNAPLTSPGGEQFPTLGANEVAALTLGTGVTREIVLLTAYTAGATSGTIVRAQGGTTAQSHVAGARVVHTYTTDDFGQTNDEAQGHGLGAVGFPPPWSADAGGVAAGKGATVQDGYSGYVVLGGAQMFLGPNGWQDGVVIGPGAKASGEGIAIGPEATAIQYGSVSITDYASGQPAAGDIGIGAYLDFGNFDEATLGYAYGPPGNLAVKSTTRTDGSSQFTEATVPYYYVKLIGPGGQSGPPQSIGSQFVAAGDVVDITFNNDTELEGSLANTDEIRLYAQYGSLGADTEWLLVQTLDVSAASYPVVLTDDGSAQGDAPDPSALVGWLDSGVEGRRVMIGYGNFITSGVQAQDSVAVGPNNVLTHDRAVLIGDNLATLRDDEVRIGGLNHFMVLPGAIELATITVTSDYTIDSGNNSTVVFVDAASNPVTVTLPAAEDGRTILFKRLDATANAVSIATPGSETIDGLASEPLNDQYDAHRLVSDGVNWFRF